MPWIAAELSLDAQLVDVFADSLLESGAISVDLSDAHSGTPAEQALFGEPGESTAGAWGENRLVSLFDHGADVQRALEAAAGLAGLASVPAYRTFPVADQDWVRLTQSQFEPIVISERLSIVPSWHAGVELTPVAIEMDPGLAFGTGSHPTTYLCLQWLDRYLQPGDHVIDYGCGSGILAITAARLGAAAVVGIDIDATALRASRENARRNGVQPRFVDTEAADIEAADVVIANILASPLRVLAPLLSSLTRAGGRLVLSGILETQAEELMALYQSWFDMQPAVARQGWVRLEGIRLAD